MTIYGIVLVVLFFASRYFLRHLLTGGNPNVREARYVEIVVAAPEEKVEVAPENGYLTDDQARRLADMRERFERARKRK
jgi:hypothetical protein